MPVIVKRIKDTAVHFAVAVDGDGRVTRWADASADPVKLGEADADRVRAEYADRPAAGDIEILAEDGLAAPHPTDDAKAEMARLRKEAADAKAEASRLTAENAALKAAKSDHGDPAKSTPTHTSNDHAGADHGRDKTATPSARK